MAQRIVIIQGHPDPAGGHYCHALAEAYAVGARVTGHELRRIEVAQLEVPLLRNKADFENGALPDDIAGAQEALAWAEHWVLVYPLWLGTMPALLKAFLEQALRPGFAFDYRPDGAWHKRLAGRSARVVVTMAMPAWAYNWVYGAHSLKSLERHILGFVGIGPIQESVIGLAEADDPASREAWLARLTDYGRDGE